MSQHSFIKVFTGTRESCYCIRALDWERIEQAVLQHIETGKDSLLELVGHEGCEVRVRVSQISDFFLSTPATRERGYEITKEVDSETIPE